jgi:hypothetical protein
MAFLGACDRTVSSWPGGHAPGQEKVALRAFGPLDTCIRTELQAQRTGDASILILDDNITVT